MTNNSSTIEILGTTGRLTATDGDQVAIVVDLANPAIIAGIPYTFRAYMEKNAYGSWRSKSSLFIDRAQEEDGGYSRDWNRGATQNAQGKVYRAIVEAAEAVGQDQLDAGTISRLEQKVVTAKEALTRQEAEYDAAKNLLAEASAQLAAKVSA